MDPYGARQSPASSEHTLSHRISSLSDVADYETYDSYHSQVQSPPLRGRDSLVSLQSSHDQVQSPSQYGNATRSTSNSPAGWSMPFSGYNSSSGGGYEPVPVSGGPSSQRSRTFSRKTSQRNVHETITEEPEGIRESIDMATLVNHGAPMGMSKPYAALPKDDLEEEEEGGVVPFDVTGFMGPATSQDDAFMKSLQQQEASGKLTGGLGVGLGADTTMKESELLAASPITERSMDRTFSRRSALNRRSTVKALAQQEANKRGEIVQIIMEESDARASEVDLSVVVGPTAVSDYSGMRRTTLPPSGDQTVIAYPEPDWKPFSMRWPYLLSLIILSMGLAGIQEVIYQTSTRQHLLEFRSPSEIPGSLYFAFKFAPTLVTVTYGVLWQITDFEVKRLEAFYQLSKESGALAGESINVDYIIHFSFLRPFRALYCKHYAVAISSVASLLAVSLVPTLGTACIVLNPDRATRDQHPGDMKYITIDPVWSRLLTAVLFIISFLGCILFWLLQSRKSGLLSDVKGIAGLASMAVVSHILNDFKDMDVATHQDIHHKLKGRRYVLRNSSLVPEDQFPASSQDVERYKENHLSQNPHPLMLRFAGSVPFISGIVLFACMIPIFLFTDANIVTDKAPWIVTALAVCIKMAWGGLETSVRMMEPYFILSQRHAPPKTLTLDYTAMPFAWAAIQALLNRHVLVFSVGFGTVMAELLTVLVTSLATVDGRNFFGPGGDAQGRNVTANATGTALYVLDSDHELNSGQETELSFWALLSVVLFILFYMGIVALIVFIRRRRPFLPRQPNTIASVLAFIHQSKMLYDFVGTSKLNNAEMTTKLEAVGKRYGLGWFEGRDGQTHCGVDQEDLMSSYKLGYDYSRSNKPWMERPVEWL